jgi:hypothetical protein
MAIRTVSAAGGNFNATGTWVGAVAPVAGDGIVANATSGNLTLSADTVSLISADFTGYTGTLALSTREFTFNTAGTVFLTIGSGMTITFTTGSGRFRISRAITITSNGKALPVSITGNNTTTLVGDLTINYSNNLNTTITGADAIFTSTTSVDLSSLTMASGFKFYIRPSATMALSSTGLPRGYTVFDTTQSITITDPIQLQPGTAVANTDVQTIEFGKTASWSGAGTTNGRPNLMYNLTGAWSGSTFSLVSTANNNIYELMSYMGAGISVKLNLTKKLNLDGLIVLSVPGTSKATLNVVGSGGFSASNVFIDNTRIVNGNAFSVNTSALKLTSDGTYSITNLLVSGLTAGNIGLLSSFTASVPATVSITSGGYFYAEITDINNVGTTQYALTQSSNTLLRTTGFTNSVSGGGGGGAFTFVN